MSADNKSENNKMKIVEIPDDTETQESDKKTGKEDVIELPKEIDEIEEGKLPPEYENENADKMWEHLVIYYLARTKGLYDWSMYNKLPDATRQNAAESFSKHNTDHQLEERVLKNIMDESMLDQQKYWSSINPAKEGKTKEEKQDDGKSENNIIVAGFEQGRQQAAQIVIRALKFGELAGILKQTDLDYTYKIRSKYLKMNPEDSCSTSNRQSQDNHHRQSSKYRKMNPEDSCSTSKRQSQDNHHRQSSKYVKMNPEDSCSTSNRQSQDNHHRQSSKYRKINPEDSCSTSNRQSQDNHHRQSSRKSHKGSTNDEHVNEWLKKFQNN